MWDVDPFFNEKLDDVEETSHLFFLMDQLLEFNGEN